MATNRTRYKELSDRSWLEERYIDRLMSVDAIADELGCQKSSVARALKRNGIQARVHTSRFPLLNDKEWLRAIYEDEKLSLNQIAAKAGSTSGNVHSALKCLGIKTRNNKEGVKIRNDRGDKKMPSKNITPGKSIRNGYILVHKPEHPYAHQSGYILEHRLIMEKHIGRYIEPDEEIHHINGIKKDNRITNLLLVNRSQHKQLHAMLNKSKKQEKEIARLIKRELARR